jgi:signal transduction histidine kinase
MFVTDLLDFQKLRVGKMPLNVASCDLADVLEETASLVQSVADAKRISLTMPTGHWIVSCDKSKTVQTVTNLVSNALKFTPDGGAISVAVSDVGDAVRVSVRDSGPGVPEAYQQRIFEAFEQAPGSENSGIQGTGLGLAICKLIVEAHGGSIGVDTIFREGAGVSSQAAGSNFWFTIPKKGSV